MERRLIVMRHAQSPKGPDYEDHERPLTDKGRREADEIGKRLVEAGWVPDLVVSSDAQRTRLTFEKMAEHFNDDPEVVFDESLYLAGVDAIEEALVEHGDDATTVLVLGHNPGWQAAVSYLGGRNEVMMTANAALLSTTADDWSQTMDAGSFDIQQVLRPRQL